MSSADQSPTDFPTLMASLQAEGDGYSVSLPEDWLQGRTAYGGLSAALCYQAAINAAQTEMPPLRSAQFAFIGPAIGKLTLQPTLLRQGKSAAFYGVDQFGDAGLSTRAMLCFGAPRASAIDHIDLPAPTAQPADESPPLFPPQPQQPEADSAPKSFAQHFEQRFAGGSRPRGDDAEPLLQVWLRHADDKPSDTIAHLIALADALPAASIILFPQRAPFSTMTWSIDILDPAPRSRSGWWLASSRAEATREGYSAQSMTLWNDEGVPVMAMRQTVAIFC